MLFARYIWMVLSVFVLLAVAGCSSEPEPEFGRDAFTEEELTLVDNDQGCFTDYVIGLFDSGVGIEPAGEVVEYDDEYIEQDKDGVCLTQADLDEQDRIEAEEKAEEAAREAARAEHEAEIRRRTDTAIERHEANLPEYREKLARLTDGRAWNEVLSEAVTYYCLLSDSGDAVHSALSEATREVYDSAWRADGAFIWPKSFGQAASRHVCRAPVTLETTLELIKDSSEEPVEPSKYPEYSDTPPPHSEQVNPHPGESLN